MNERLIMGLLAKPQHPSKWQFSNWTSYGASLDIVSYAGGSFSLIDPKGLVQKFNYNGIGVGLSTPSLKKGAPTGTLAPSFMRSKGKVSYYSDSGELDKSDITGLCVFTEISAVVGGGGSVTAIYLGLNLPLSLISSAVPVIGSEYMRRAKGVILLYGFSLGWEASIGVNYFWGEIHDGAHKKFTKTDPRLMQKDNIPTMKHPRILLRR